MGIEIEQIQFTQEEVAAFKIRLEENLASLKKLLATPGFGAGPASIGAELEMYVIDAQGHPLHINQEILQRANDSQLTLELNRYNLEYNLTPCLVSEQAFAAIEHQLRSQLERLNNLSAELDGRVVPIGILPTLTDRDLGTHCITDRKRYHALVAQLIRRRGSHFSVDINGENPLKLDMADITLEGANTSFQVHYRVDPKSFADTFNAIQMATPLVLALAANSPTLFGRCLWHETRIPLFKQSIDTRHRDRYGWNEPPRVNFGRGWLRDGALEQFQEVVRLYEPLLPVCDNNNHNPPVPRLSELRLHQSTVWLWNRPIYDDAEGGMLRVEMRALPAGPTPVDMTANSAFLIGLAEGLKPMINDLLPALPFNTAEYNFYRAAQFGLGAKLVWPETRQYGGKPRPILEILEAVLPLARKGLQSIGVSHQEIERYMSVIEQRIEKSQTGATWQLEKLRQLGLGEGNPEALYLMLKEYIQNSRANLPVAEWT